MVYRDPAHCPDDTVKAHEKKLEEIKRKGEERLQSLQDNTKKVLRHLDAIDRVRDKIALTDRADRELFERIRKLRQYVETSFGSSFFQLTRKTEEELREAGEPRSE